MILTQTNPVAVINLPGPEKLVLITVALHADNTHTARLSKSYLAQRTGLDPKTVQRACFQLESLSFIDSDRAVVRGRGKTTLTFHLHLEVIQSYASMQTKVDTSSSFQEEKVDTSSSFQEEKVDNKTGQINDLPSKTGQLDTIKLDKPSRAPASRSYKNNSYVEQENDTTVTNVTVASNGKSPEPAGEASKPEVEQRSTPFAFAERFYEEIGSTIPENDRPRRTACGFAKKIMEGANVTVADVPNIVSCYGWMRPPSLAKLSSDIRIDELRTAKESGSLYRLHTPAILVADNQQRFNRRLERIQELERMGL